MQKVTATKIFKTVVPLHKTCKRDIT
ncbi:MAG TPA: hypothetical protein VMW67_03910 [Desulfobacteria bacterium]|nr:hypothetical protein [Desulfobacteria bacterium]